MCSPLYRSTQASRPARTDSSAKQKCIGLLADGWGSTPSQTLSLCSRAVRHPSCERTHRAHSVSPLHVNSLPPLIMCEEGKSSLPGQSGTSSLLKFWRIQQLPLSCRPGCVCWTSHFVQKSSETQPACPTRQEAIVALVSSEDTDASDGLLFSQLFCSFETM